jgi:hypothetical protein
MDQFQIIIDSRNFLAFQVLGCTATLAAGLPNLVDAISSPSAEVLFVFCSVFTPHHARFSRFKAAAARWTHTEMPRFVEVQGKRNIAHGFWELDLSHGPW